MSLNSLHIASSALRASKLQVEITSRNISGVSDPNYTRQTAQVRNVGPAQATLTGHTHGLGVIVEGFDRTRDALLDRSFRVHHRAAQGANSVDPLANRLESVLGDGSGLLETARDIRLGLLEVAGHPEDVALRADLLQNIQNLTDRFHATSSELQDLGAESKARMEAGVERFNEILNELAGINKELPPLAKTSGRNALLDQRDALLDELSSLAEVRTVEQKSGAVAVYLDGRQMLFGTKAEGLVLDDDQNLQTTLGTSVSVEEGVLGANSDFGKLVIPQFREKLDALASSLADEFNSVHRNGYGLDGLAGRDLFSGDSASTLKPAISDPAQLGAASARMTSSAALNENGFSPTLSLASQSGTLPTPPSSSGSVDINGTIVNWTDTMSTDAILESFSAAGVAAAYDSSTGKVSLQKDPNAPPPPDIVINDVTGNLVQALALDTAVSAPAIPGDGAVLRALQQKLDEVVELDAGLSALQTRSGSVRRSFQDEAERASLLEADAKGRRDNVSAVSLDEELLALERYQQSFAAAARIAATADDILETIINLGRN